MITNKVSLFIMTYKGYRALDALVAAVGSTVIDKVIISRDGNIASDYYEEIRKTCIEHRIPVFDREEAYEIMTEYQLAISWRWLINTGVDQRLIVLHDSILPRYRGFAPLVNALVNGEREVGVTALFATDNYDCGEIIDQLKIAISYPIKVNLAIDKVSELYGDITTRIVARIAASRTLSSVPQDETIASYSLWLNDDDYFINWHKDASYIRRFIDAVGFPYKGACAFDGIDSFRILEAEEEADVTIENRQPGKVIFIKDGSPVVVCGKGLLRLLSITDAQGATVKLKKFRTKFLSHVHTL